MGQPVTPVCRTALTRELFQPELPVKCIPVSADSSNISAVRASGHRLLQLLGTRVEPRVPRRDPLAEPVSSSGRFRDCGPGLGFRCVDQNVPGRFLTQGDSQPGDSQPGTPCGTNGCALCDALPTAAVIERSRESFHEGPMKLQKSFAGARLDGTASSGQPRLGTDGRRGSGASCQRPRTNNAGRQSLELRSPGVRPHSDGGAPRPEPA